MTTRQGVRTATDRHRLRDMIGSVRQSLPTRLNPFEAYVRDLEGHLAHKLIVPPACVHADTVTMNTRLRLQDLEAGVNQVVTLVYEPDSDPFGEKLSVLTGLGASLLGARVGDVVE